MADGIDPPWRTDPFQNIINVHWGSKSEGGGGGDIKLPISVGGGTSASWNHWLAVANAPPYDWSHWHGNDCSGQFETSFAAGHAGCTCICDVAHSRWSPFYGYTASGMDGFDNQQEIETWFQNKGSIWDAIGNPLCLTGAPSGSATLGGSTASAEAYAWTIAEVYNSWCDPNGVIPGGRVTVLTGSYDFSGATIVHTKSGDTWKFNRITDVVYSSNGQGAGGVLVLKRI